MMAEGGAALPKDMGTRIQQVMDRLDVFHRRLRDVEKRIEQVEHWADHAGLPRVRYAALDAFTRITDTGAQLVDCHLQLTRILAPPRQDTAGDAEHE